MASEPLFSVVVPASNNAADLRRCLSSLRAQTLEPKRFEVIVVASPSDDDTQQVPAEFGFRCISGTYRTQFAARNDGIAAARGTLVAFIDSDCEACPDWLEQFAAVVDDEEAGAFAGEILPKEPRTSVERFSSRLAILKQRVALSGLQFQSYPRIANAVYRKAVFDKVGLFDPTVDFGDDAAFAWHMRATTNWTIRFVPAAIVRQPQRCSLDGLYTQLRRRGKSWLTWTLGHKEYVPPAVSRVENNLLELLEKHVQLLEQTGAPAEYVQSALEVTAEAAQMAGYMQALVRHLAGPEFDKLAEVVRNRASSCNVCGGCSFIPGPGGRLVKGKPPRCRSCGSLERHRHLYSFFEMRGRHAAGMNCLSVGDNLGAAGKLFGTYRHVRLDDIARDARGPYDIVVGVNLLTSSASGNLTAILESLVKALHEKSLLALYESGAQFTRGGGEKFVAQVADRLPNARVNSTVVVDSVTGESAVMAVALARDARLTNDIATGTQPGEVVHADG